MPLELLPMLPPVAILVFGVFAPGRRAARVAAFGIALTLFTSRLFPLWPSTIVWSLLWVALGWRLGREDTRSSARGGVESGAIGLVIGLAILGLLMVAAMRQQLAPGESARVMAGLAFIALGVLHLMLRRNAVRAAASFGALGLGVHVLLDAAERASVMDASPDPLGVPLAAGLAAALAIRLGRTRREVAGSPVVSDAHDLHD